MKSHQIDAPKTRNGKAVKAYASWIDMIHRCTNPKRQNYRLYGRRGIKVCGFLQSYENFYSLMGDRTLDLSLDRIDNALHYSCGQCEQCQQENWPMNLQWATNKQQSRNTRTNHRIFFQGKNLTIVEWAEQPDQLAIGLTATAISKRLERGDMSIRDILTKPAPYNQTMTYNGETRYIQDWAEITGIPKDTLFKRCNQGLDPIDVLAPVKFSRPAPNKGKGDRYRHEDGRNLTLPQWAQQPDVIEKGISQAALYARIGKGKSITEATSELPRKRGKRTLHECADCETKT